MVTMVLCEHQTRWETDVHPKKNGRAHMDSFQGTQQRWDCSLAAGQLPLQRMQGAVGDFLRRSDILGSSPTI